MRTRSVRSLVYLAGGVGLIVSIFAALEYYEASLRRLCTISSFFSCATVDVSGRTTTLGLPDFLWGVGGFVLILVVAGLAERWPRDRRYAYALLGVTTLGVAFSLYFLYVQLVEIGALCVVCATADVFGWIAWAGAIALVRAPSSSADSDGPADAEDAG